MIARPGFVIALVVAVLGYAGYQGWSYLTEAPERDDTRPGQEFRVEAGEGLGVVADRLAKDGLIVSAPRFRLLARVLRVDRAVHVGTYRFRRGADPRSVLDDLVNGRVRALRLTVPEGWRLERIAREAARVLEFSAEDFLAAAADTTRRQRMGDVESLEGYLYPDTYFFADGTDAGAVVDAMLTRFEAVWNRLEGDAPEDWTRHEVVTLASIVVAETSLAEEKPRVAAVYLNRLREGWRLEADPTVRYGLARFTGRLYFKHLDVDTPYNTYRNRGLPPGPIASPGREALQAVLRPLIPCDDFFFVADGRGGHIFSRTNAEHDRARRRIREAAVTARPPSPPE